MALDMDKILHVVIIMGSVLILLGILLYLIDIYVSGGITLNLFIVIVGLSIVIFGLIVSKLMERV